MIEVNEITFWGICLVAAMGLVRAGIEIFSTDKAAEKKSMNWAQSEQPEAPAGFKWVLVRLTDIKD